MSDISITAANVLRVANNTKTEQGFAGEAVAAGQWVQKDATDGYKFKLADNNHATTALRTPRGMAMNSRWWSPMKVTWTWAPC